MRQGLGLQYQVAEAPRSPAVSLFSRLLVCNQVQGETSTH